MPSQGPAIASKVDESLDASKQASAAKKADDGIPPGPAQQPPVKSNIGRNLLYGAGALAIGANVIPALLKDSDGGDEKNPANVNPNLIPQNPSLTDRKTTLTFTGAPPSGTNNIYVVHQAKSVGTIDPPATETIAKTFSGNVTMSGTNTLSGTTTVSGALTASGGATISGTTPTLTVGDAGAEDAKIVFDGNAQDYHIGLDDSSDTLVVGLGSALGTTSYLTIDSAGHARFPNTSCFQAHLASDQSVSGSTSATVTMNTESFDINGDFNTSNYTFTAPVTGKYLLTTGVSNFAAAGGSTDYVQVLIHQRQTLLIHLQKHRSYKHQSFPVVERYQHTLQ